MKTAKAILHKSTGQYASYSREGWSTHKDPYFIGDGATMETMSLWILPEHSEFLKEVEIVDVKYEIDHNKAFSWDANDEEVWKFEAPSGTYHQGEFDPKKLDATTGIFVWKNTNFEHMKPYKEYFKGNVPVPRECMPIPVDNESFDQIEKMTLLAVKRMQFGDILWIRNNSKGPHTQEKVAEIIAAFIYNNLEIFKNI